MQSISLSIKTIILICCISLLTQCTSPSSTLPSTIPANTEMTYDEAADGYFPFSVIAIRNDSLHYFEKRSAHDSAEVRWQVALSKTEIENIYRSFYENKIDLIKMGSPSVIWEGAASKNLSLRIGSRTYFTSYGSNTPLSRDEAKRFTAVADAIIELKKKYQH